MKQKQKNHPNHIPKKLPRICLNMIVKNEAHVIEECLQSIVHLVDYYVINDTGSTDNTREKIKEFFDKHNIKGEIIDHEFRTCKCHGPEYKKYEYFHFGWNRTYALEKCIGKSEYIFIMDADDVVEGKLLFPQTLIADQYYLKFRTDFNSYVRPQLVKNDPKYKWEYKDGLHEFLHSDHPNIITYTLIDNYAINSRRLGDRNKDPEKYLKDVKFLEILMKERPEYPRYKHFYAQSLYDAKLYEEAIKAYEEYIPFETFEEAKYLAMLMIGRAYLKIDTSIKNEHNVVRAFKRCFEHYPEYAEPMYEICKFYSALQKYEEAYKYGVLAVDLKLPFNKVLSIDSDVYNFKLLDEMVWCATEIKKYEEAIKWSNKILELNKYPPDQKSLIETNVIILTSLKQQTETNDLAAIEKVFNAILFQTNNVTEHVTGFYLGPSPLETVYGSELAAQNLAKEFINNGNIVIIFADQVKKAIKPSTYKDIIYLPSFVLKRWHELNVNIQLETMIVSRYVNYFIEVNAKLVARKTFMWLHDINIHPYYNGAHLPNSANAIVNNIDNIIDGYICSSPWHKNHLVNTYKLNTNKVHIVGLGVNIDLCKTLLKNDTRVKNRFIWVSDYQRGLEEFVNDFIMIRNYVKNAELHIYRDLPDNLKTKWKSFDFIKLLGHTDNDSILKAMSESEYFCYVTTFPETFCLSALEAQALGCICITSHIAALESTVADRGLIIDPSIKGGKFIEQFMKLHHDTERKITMRSYAQKWAFEQSWKNKAHEWLSIINRTRNHTQDYTHYPNNIINEVRKPVSNIFNRLNCLRKFGFNPKIVLDIGANIGDWSMNFKQFYPNTYIKAYEANPQCVKYLQEKKIDYEIILLGNKNKPVSDFYIIPGSECTTGASIFKETTTYYNVAETISLPMKRLDDVVKNDVNLHTKLQSNRIDLMKLDVQGAELNILEGGREIMKKTDFILLEVSIMKYNEGSPLINDVISYMFDCGFNVFDILENHYINDCCIQADILFLNRNAHWTKDIAEINKIATCWHVNNIYDSE